MKTKHLFAATVIGLLFLGSIGLNAQTAPDSDKNANRDMKPGFKKEMRQGTPGHQGIPGLTDDQKAKMKDIRMASYKELKSLENQLGELRAKEHTLATADKPDLNAINANIDDITKVQNKIMKAKAAAHQQVRALLTDEQKMVFDSQKEKFGQKFGRKGFGHSGQGLREQNKQAGHMHPNN